MLLSSVSPELFLFLLLLQSLLSLLLLVRSATVGCSGELSLLLSRATSAARALFMGRCEGGGKVRFMFMAHENFKTAKKDNA